MKMKLALRGANEKPRPVRRGGADVITFERLGLSFHQRPLPPPPALPLGIARSGRFALPPAAELDVMVSAPVAPREITTSFAFPVVLGWRVTMVPSVPG